MKSCGPGLAKEHLCMQLEHVAFSLYYEMVKIHGSCYATCVGSLEMGLPCILKPPLLFCPIYLDFDLLLFLFCAIWVIATSTHMD